VELLLERGALVSAAKQGAKVADGRRTVTVGVGTLLNELDGGGLGGIVGHEDAGEVLAADGVNAVDCTGEEWVRGVEVHEDDQTVVHGKETVDAGLVGDVEELELAAERGGEERLQCAVVGVEADADSLHVQTCLADG
jgi:hypothetical protein